MAIQTLHHAIVPFVLAMSPKQPVAGESTDKAAGTDASADGGSGAQGGGGSDDVAGVDTVWDTLLGLWESLLAHTPMIIASVVVLILTALAAYLGRRIGRTSLKRVRMRRSLKELIERFIIMAVWVVGLMIAAVVLFPGLSPADAIAALGVGSIAIGLAFRDIFENLFAGILILWRFPFENGDFIECDGILGKVEDVTIRNTMLRTVEGVLVVIPNSKIYKNAVDVLTVDDRRRQTVMCGVSYDSDLGEAQKVINDAVDGCDTVDSSKPIEIFAQAFGASSIDFEVTWWTGPTPLEQRKSRDQVVQSVFRALNDAGIEIPFPQRTLSLTPDTQSFVAQASGVSEAGGPSEDASVDGRGQGDKED